MCFRSAFPVRLRPRITRRSIWTCCLTGVILHDIGKVEEFSYARGSIQFRRATAGPHHSWGCACSTKFEHLPDFPQKLRTLVEHLIVSHHGELEFGSPKVPIFAEALLLHHLDNLDSKMDAVRGALQRDRAVEGEFTGWIAPLERVLLKKERYLEEPKVAAPAAVKKVEPEAVAPVAAPPVPAAPVAPTPAKPVFKSPQNSLFAEKLQAVLEPHK